MTDKETKFVPNVSDMLRAHIAKQIENNYDYSLKSNKKIDVKNFIDANKELDLNFENVRKIHANILPKMYVKKGINPKSMGIGVRKKNPTWRGGAKSWESEISPKPQGSPQDLQSNQGTNQNQTQTLTNDPAQMTQTPPKVIINNFDNEGVSATINGFYLMFKSAIPELELLTDDEKKSLGKLWTPAFNQYLTERWAVIGVPILATGGIFIPKFIKAKKVRHENKLKKIDETKYDKDLIRKIEIEQEKDFSDVKITKKEGDDLWNE